MCAGDRPRAARVALEDHRLLGREERTGPMDLPRFARVLGGTKYGCAPALRSAARASMRGAKRADHARWSVAGAAATNGARSIASR